MMPTWRRLRLQGSASAASALHQGRRQQRAMLPGVAAAAAAPAAVEEAALAAVAVAGVHAKLRFRVVQPPAMTNRRLTQRLRSRRHCLFARTSTCVCVCVCAGVQRHDYSQLNAGSAAGDDEAVYAYPGEGSQAMAAESDKASRGSEEPLLLSQQADQ